MARKTKERKNLKKGKSALSYVILRTAIVILVLGFLTVLFCRRFISFAVNAHYFQVQDITSNVEVPLADLKRISALKGQSIFKVDPAEVQKSLQRTYPHAQQIRVFKRFPNQIFIELTPRIPFARFALVGQNGVIDRGGFVITRTIDGYSHLPVLSGFSTAGQGLFVGRPITSKELHVGLEMIEVFNKTQPLKNHTIQKVDVSNLSRIYLYLDNNANIIFDQERISERMLLLSVIAKRANLDWSQVRYIDLRFEEPVIKMK